MTWRVRIVDVIFRFTFIRQTVVSIFIFFFAISHVLYSFFFFFCCCPRYVFLCSTLPRQNASVSLFLSLFSFCYLDGMGHRWNKNRNSRHNSFVKHIEFRVFRIKINEVRQWQSGWYIKIKKKEQKNRSKIYTHFTVLNPKRHVINTCYAHRLCNFISERMIETFVWKAIAWSVKWQKWQ